MRVLMHATVRPPQPRPGTARARRTANATPRLLSQRGPRERGGAGLYVCPPYVINFATVCAGVGCNTHLCGKHLRCLHAQEGIFLDSMDLLETPCIHARTWSRGLSPLTLPGVLAGLDDGDLAGFPELRPHQEAPWHAFLVHIAALAQRATDSRKPVDAPTWAARLLTLSRHHGADNQGWRLHVSSPSTPAVLQPAAPGGLGWQTFATPDDGLDLLVNAKYHDRKFDLARRAQPEHWLYALVTVQACAGYDGPRLYHTARVNGAFASRTFLGTAPVNAATGAVDVSAWWRRDVDLLLSMRPITAGDPAASSRRPALLWLVPWPEREQLSLSDLDPWFLDTPRRVRMSCSTEGDLAVQRAGSVRPRLDSAGARGVTGDPWTAVHAKEGKALALAGPLDDRRLLDLLFGRDWTPPPCVRWDPPDGSRQLAIFAHGLAKRDKKIIGHYRRLVAVPPAAAAVLAAGPISTDTGDVIRADLARLFGAVRSACTIATASGPSASFVNAATRALEQELDGLLRFFWDALTAADVAHSHEARRRQFAVAANRALDRALAAVPGAASSRPLIAARARARLRRSLHFVLSPPSNDRSQPSAGRPDPHASATVD